MEIFIIVGILTITCSVLGFAFRDMFKQAEILDEINTNIKRKSDDFTI